MRVEAGGGGVEEGGVQRVRADLGGVGVLQRGGGGEEEEGGQGQQNSLKGGG